LTYIFDVLAVQLDTVYVIFERQVHRIKFTVTEGKSCWNGRSVRPRVRSF